MRYCGEFGQDKGSEMMDLIHEAESLGVGNGFAVWVGETPK